MFLKTLVIFLSLLYYIATKTYTSSYADCLEFAALFNNTCTSTTRYRSYYRLPYETIRCPIEGSCVGATVGGQCQW